MTERIFLIGTENQGLSIAAFLTENGKFNSIIDVTLLMFGQKQPIGRLTEGMRLHLKDYIIAELNIEEQYRSLEQQFEQRLGEKVVINNRNTFENVALEYARRTSDDNFMKDLNN